MGQGALSVMGRRKIWDAVCACQVNLPCDPGSSLAKIPMHAATGTHIMFALTAIGVELGKELRRGQRRAQRARSARNRT